MIFIVGLISGIIIAILLAGIIVYTQVKAKEEAKRIIASGMLTDLKKIDRILNILAKTSNDLEATRLFNQLYELRHQRLLSRG